jgi:hypothetical protein
MKRRSYVAALLATPLLVSGLGNSPAFGQLCGVVNGRCQGQCLTVGDECAPTTVECDGNNRNCQIVECGCRGGSNTCSIRGEGTILRGCGGQCPGATEECKRMSTNLPGGRVRHECECENNPCRAENNSCTGLCEDGQDRCRPTAVQCDEQGGSCTITECTCQGHSCEVQSPRRNPRCRGTCPRGPRECQSLDTECMGGRVQLEGGGFTLKCECQGPPCEPKDDGSGCKQAQCPDPENCCVPTEIKCDRNDRNCRVTQCECKQPRRCELHLQGMRVRDCRGPCPDPNIECRHHPALIHDTLEMVHTCRCDPPVEEGCRPRSDDEGGFSDRGVTAGDIIDDFCEGVCPDGGVCQAVEVSNGDGLGLIDCVCVHDTSECAAEFNSAGEIVCNDGLCPLGQTCVLFEFIDDNGNVFFDCHCDGGFDTGDYSPEQRPSTPRMRAR